MTEPSQQLSKRKTFDIDTATKLIAFIAIILYIIGFFTTNLYLQQLGFSDFSLLKLRFILTGGLALIPISFSCLLAVINILMMLSSSKTTSSNTASGTQTQPSKFPICFIAFFVGITPLIMFVGFSAKTKNIGAFQLIENSLILYISSLLLRMIPLTPWLLTSRFTFPGRAFFSMLVKFLGKTKNIDRGYYLLLTIFLVYLYLFFLYLNVFAKNFYPLVPEQFGGGEPRQVRILFAKDQADTIKQNGIPTCSSGKLKSNWSKPVSLLFEGSEHYLLRLDNTRPPIQLRKTTIIGLELISRKYEQKQKLADCPLYLTK